MNVVKYLQESLSELKRVSWPKREQALKMTGIVIGASLAIGLYVGGLDFLFTNILGILFK